jgi:hypothetical protein
MNKLLACGIASLLLAWGTLGTLATHSGDVLAAGEKHQNAYKQQSVS